MKPHRYQLHLDADLNRVFTGALLEIAATELRVVLDSVMPGAVDEITRTTFGRAQLLQFDSEAEPEALAPIIGQLSTAAALFVADNSANDGPDERMDQRGQGPPLHPVLITENLVFGTELVTTQRYRGKTNERLTRAMVNMGLAAAGLDPSKPTGTLLDPMCGRGTTLNWAVAYGLNAVGIESDASALGHHATFLETWAKRARLPHKAERFRKNNGEHRVASIRVARDRHALKAGGQLVQTFAADSAQPGLLISKGSIDLIVTDLPYGVQHRGSTDGANKSDKGQRSQRSQGGNQSERGEKVDEDSTVALLKRVLPTWHRHLRTGGSLCMAWNTKRATRRELSSVLTKAGFAPITVSGGYSMSHTVDATIDRDVMVATRTTVRPHQNDRPETA